MLTFQKNKLINLLLQFEIAFNELTPEIKKDDSVCEVYPDWNKTKQDYCNIIARNIKSIKTQINKS